MSGFVGKSFPGILTYGLLLYIVVYIQFDSKVLYVVNEMQ